MITRLKCGGTFSDAARFLNEHYQSLSPQDPFLPVVDAFLQNKTSDQAAADLDLDPGARSIGLYMLAQYCVYSGRSPEKADGYLEELIALRIYELPEYYLALKSLDRVPSYPARLLREAGGMASDLGRLGDRLKLALKNYGR
jgi:hypothetical protein